MTQLASPDKPIKIIKSEISNKLKWVFKCHELKRLLTHMLFHDEEKREERKTLCAILLSSNPHGNSFNINCTLKGLGLLSALSYAY